MAAKALGEYFKYASPARRVPLHTVGFSAIPQVSISLGAECAAIGGPPWHHAYNLLMHPLKAPPPHPVISTRGHSEGFTMQLLWHGVCTDKASSGQDKAWFSRTFGGALSSGAPPPLEQLTISADIEPHLSGESSTCGSGIPAPACALLLVVLPKSALLIRESTPRAALAAGGETHHLYAKECLSEEQLTRALRDAAFGSSVSERNSQGEWHPTFSPLLQWLSLHSPLRATPLTSLTTARDDAHPLLYAPVRVSIGSLLACRWGTNVMSGVMPPRSVLINRGCEARLAVRHPKEGKPLSHQPAASRVGSIRQKAVRLAKFHQLLDELDDFKRSFPPHTEDGFSSSHAKCAQEKAKEARTSLLSNVRSRWELLSLSSSRLSRHANTLLDDAGIHASLDSATKTGAEQTGRKSRLLPDRKIRAPLAEQGRSGKVSTSGLYRLSEQAKTALEAVEELRASTTEEKGCLTVLKSGWAEERSDGHISFSAPPGVDAETIAAFVRFRDSHGLQPRHLRRALSQLGISTTELETIARLNAADKGNPLDLEEFAAIAKELQSAHAEQQVVLLPDEALQHLPVARFARLGLDARQLRKAMVALSLVASTNETISLLHK
ncbi:MAG: hypothetical protein SGPRY_001143 [Prymnesium sp.]